MPDPRILAELNRIVAREKRKDFYRRPRRLGEMAGHAFDRITAKRRRYRFQDWAAVERELRSVFGGDYSETVKRQWAAWVCREYEDDRYTMGREEWIASVRKFKDQRTRRGMNTRRGERATGA